MADGGAETSTADTFIDDANRLERHPDMSAPVAVAPSTFEDDTFNTLRPGIRTIACWRLEDHHFDFDSSFVLPATKDEIGRLAPLFVDYEECPLSIFGHADPVGRDDYNKKLSGQRAKVVHALLTRKIEVWEKLYTDPSWGVRSTQIILSELEGSGVVGPDPIPEGYPYDAAPASGATKKAFENAVRRFQTQNGLEVDGDPGTQTRKRLYEVYMDYLCTPKNGGEPFRIRPEQFLGHGKDSGGKADYQGCSEFNPILLLSEARLKEFGSDQVARNVANAPNRRVVMYFFPVGLEIDPAKWPCPRAEEGTTACRKRFWTTHEARRKPDPELDRDYKKEPNTFACRFYDRLARRSPCEAGFQEYVVQLMAPKPDTGELAPVAGVRYLVKDRTLGVNRTQGVTDANGLVRVRQRAEKEELELVLSTTEGEGADTGNPGGASGGTAGGGATPGAGSGEASSGATQSILLARLTLDGGALQELEADEDLGGVQRLHNLGYGPARTADWEGKPDVAEQATIRFQKDHGLSETGALDEATVAKLREQHGS